MSTPPFDRINDTLWEIPRRGGMRVSGRIYARKGMLPDISRDKAHEQVANMAHLPGIVGHALAMPDIHWGYGFPIGGVAAFDADEGVISPGGVGYDINCGVRLLAGDLKVDEIRTHTKALADALFAAVPSGVGSRGPLRLSDEELDAVMVDGARWAVGRGHGDPGELAMIEENGRMAGSDPSAVSARSRQRGRRQLGTLGSGNHFLEVGWIEEIFDEDAAAAMGLRRNAMTLMIHTGSRGFGHQVCDEAVHDMVDAARRFRIPLPDRQLCCAPLDSDEGRAYLGAMAAAVNFAFANRQIIAHLVRGAVGRVLGDAAAAGLRTVYEVAHNIAKWEEHEVGGQRRRLCVYRKGATRAFGPGRPELPERYRDIGQPVLIPGDMGRCSYVLRGTERAMAETFGSACHGAGRIMSRKRALKAGRGRDLYAEMRERGVTLRAAGKRTVAEEMPEAYKDVSEVVDTVHDAGLALKIARLRPLVVVKG